MLTGTPTLRDPDGEHELEPGDLVCFPPGPEGAHKVTNRSDGVARCLIFSTMPKPEISICVYPDSDKVGGLAAREAAAHGRQPRLLGRRGIEGQATQDGNCTRRGMGCSAAFAARTRAALGDEQERDEPCGAHAALT